MFMKNKVYTFILMILCCGWWTARAQDTTTACNAQFTASVSGNTVSFRALDSAAGVQHLWIFGDTSQLGYGPYPVVSHTYSHSGVYWVTHLVRDSAIGCFDSTSQLVTIGAPPPQCSIIFTYSHDSTRPGQPYYFYAQPNLAGASSDTVTWRVNDTIVGTGDTLVRTLPNGASNVCANLVTSSGCQSQYCQTITVGDTTTPPPPPACSISFTVSHDSTKPNQPYTFNASASIDSATSDSITWTVNGTTVGTGTSLTRTFTNGSYTVCAALVTNLGCTSTSCQTITVSDTTTTPPDTAGQMIRCFPNPAYSSTNVIITLKAPTMIYIRVYNSMGGEVEEKTVSGFRGVNIINVPLGSLQQGIYYIQLQYGNELKRSRIQKL
jgi:hypothetical protein